MAGRIVAVADAYDVITSARSYKKPMSPEHDRVASWWSTSLPVRSHRRAGAFLQASIGREPSRTGALGWLLEVPRAVGSVASQAATSAGAVVTAGWIAVGVGATVRAAA